MRLHRLRSKIALVFVLLMLAIQAAVFVATRSVIASVAHAHVDAQLAMGERVFRKVLQSDTEKLNQAAAVVAADFGFREAVALRDQTTVLSALQNQGDRIHADIVMLVGLDGKLIADSRDPASAGKPFPFPSLIQHTTHKDASSIIGVVNGRPYELVLVPVKAPLTIAWVAMGFAIDDIAAREMREVASLHVSFIARPAGGQWTVLASSLPAEQRTALERASRTATLVERQSASVSLNEGFGSRIVWLAVSNQPVAAVLQTSLDEAMAPYRKLQSTLFLLTLAGVVISIAGATLTARSVTRPLAELTRFAQRIGRGDYSAPIQIAQKDEISALAAAFGQMRDDIAEREARITDLAYVDRLTGLPNRVAFNECLQQAIEMAAPERSPLAVMMLDMDRFKYVNDTLGHHIGDLLLHEVAKRLIRCVPGDTDTVARLGGDEFAILLPGGELGTAQRIAQAMLKALEEPIVIEAHVVDVAASIGIVIFPDDGGDVHSLLRRADVAMYRAKRTNAGMSVYDESEERYGEERLSLMSELRHAIEYGELRLYYQPKVDLASNDMSHVEALVRWVHPVRGVVPPGEFIPFAEQTGFIRSISRWVAGEAISQCAAWHAKGIALSVSVNVSARDLAEADFPDVLEALLRQHGVEPRWLWLEITESALMDDPAHAIAILDRLHRLGIRLSIDDFGTGYSSLSYLKRMPVDELKIDRSFVMGMVSGPDDEIIVRSTIALGHNMGLRVVAEGVEDATTLETLRTLHCDVAQGYHLGRPLSADGIESWITRWAETVASAALADEV
ncbi:diguanylate cyclase/phosphodiesterase [Paraburkholderia phenazinium]|uniref:Diguanylate cyclase/phosphodiesterase n=2 Tax=Paraburkholderia phenazinium TaxID=60549 RepID=A0A1N6KFW3_9BURK|nr:diguanylate cyclase/phosphodiesterase [Paraburkholderia phenazinium]